MKYLSYLLATLLLAGVSFLASAQGSCNNDDLAYIGADLDGIQAIATDCGLECLLADNPQQCVRDCMEAQTPLTDMCITCFVDQVQCVADNCFLACAFNPSGAGCANCVQENCIGPFQECAGILDVDGDLFTTLSDCDDNNPNINPDAEEIWYDGVDQNCDGADDYDQDGDGDRSVDFGGTDCDDLNPNTLNDAFLVYVDGDEDGFGDENNTAFACSLETGLALEAGDCNDLNNLVYPDAPGTGENIDNNCNNVLDPDEVIADCVGDFNNDSVVNSGDLIILLSEFGCSENCEYDLNGDGQVNTGDLTTFLSEIGNFCQE